jgi:hypothetical protein
MVMRLWPRVDVVPTFRRRDNVVGGVHVGTRTGRALLAVIATASIALPTTAPGARADEAVPTFSSGTWVGTAKYFGQVDQPMVSAAAEAVVNFKFRVSGGEVVEGTLTALGEGTGIEMGAGASATMNFSVNATLQGPAEYIRFQGTSTFKGTASVDGFEMPLDLSGAIRGKLEPAWATCTQAGGSFGTELGDVAAAYGTPVNVDGVFVAKRVAEAYDEDPAVWIPGDWKALVEDMEAAAEGSPTVDELGALILRIAAVDAEIVGAALCGDVPPGFEEGLVKDDYFYALLLQIFDKILDNADAYSVYGHANMLVLAVRVGAVGASAPDQVKAAALLDKFVQVLKNDLAQLPWMVDEVAAKSRAFEIYVAAKQAGLTEVAELAKAKLQ